MLKGTLKAIATVIKGFINTNEFPVTNLLVNQHVLNLTILCCSNRNGKGGKQQGSYQDQCKPLHCPPCLPSPRTLSSRTSMTTASARVRVLVGPNVPSGYPPIRPRSAKAATYGLKSRPMA